MDYGEMIEGLESIQSFYLELARGVREGMPDSSVRFWNASEVAKKAAQELKKQIPQEIEMEGGGSTWWYVCPECHGAIDSRDHYCRHCGQAVNSVAI